MIENIVKDMSDLVDQLKSSINQDILDIKEAKHDWWNNGFKNGIE